MSYEKLGRTELAADELSQARKAFEEMLGIRERLAEVDPLDMLAQDNLGLSYSNLGDVAMREGKLAEARAAYQKPQDICQRMTQSHPQDLMPREHLKDSHLKLGMVAKAAMEWKMAIESYEAAKRILVELDRQVATGAYSAAIVDVERQIEECRKAGDSAQNK